MARPSNLEINVKRDQNIRALVKKLKAQRLKQAINGSSIGEIMEGIRKEVGLRFNLAPSTIEQICKDKYYSLRWLRRRGEERQVNP